MRHLIGRCDAEDMDKVSIRQAFSSMDMIDCPDCRRCQHSDQCDEYDEDKMICDCGLVLCTLCVDNIMINCEELWRERQNV